MRILATAVVWVLLVLVSPLSGAVGSAPAVTPTTLTFDDVPSDGGAGFNLAGYGGFNWDASWGLMSDTDYAGSGGGNTYDSPSGEYAASNRGANSLFRPIEFPPGSCCILQRFDFIGASFSSFTLNDVVYHNSATSIVIEGYREGILVGRTQFDFDIVTPAAGYSWVQANFYDIDELRLIPIGGPTSFFRQFLMDDFTYAAPSAGPQNTAPTADAGSDQLVIVGNVVQLAGSGDDEDGDALTYAWALTGAPAGSTASLSNPTSANASFIPDLPGVYTARLTVSDPSGPGDPDFVQITATTAAGFAENYTQEAVDQVQDLVTAAVSNAGNQNALTQLLANAIAALHGGNITSARHQLEQAIARTDGCALRGTPDASGPSRDWITTCGAQGQIYPSLVTALAAIASS